ncbi:MAG: C40 family peptidase [Candidatus Omnitrophica bacterium]|nr:C40 family peptidase [Candidatus Omnitrophota bacterium]
MTAVTSPEYVVAVPVADLRARPETALVAGAHDDEQETQLLYGERVRRLETRGDWARIEAMEQPEYTHQGRWQGYPGWVVAQAIQPAPRARAANAIVVTKWAEVLRGASQPPVALPMGSQLHVAGGDQAGWRVKLLDGTMGRVPYGALEGLDQLNRRSSPAKRRAVLKAAEMLVGDPYVWGGRSPHDNSSPERVTGVDCSGFVNLAYRAAGIELPRDAHEQHLRARTVQRPQPADLIFLSQAGDPRKIVHVLLYAGDDWLMEGPGTGARVRRASATKRLGRSIAELKPGQQVNDQTISFGTFFR